MLFFIKYTKYVISLSKVGNPTLADGTDMLSRKVDKESPLLAA
jgi:hypothetical protein